MSMCVCSAEDVRLAESHWHHRSVSKIHTRFGQANISHPAVYLVKKQHQHLLSVRPDMPQLALVQLSGEFNLHFRLFYTAVQQIHRSVNTYCEGQC